MVRDCSYLFEPPEVEEERQEILDKVMDKLWKDAEDKTWELYQTLQLKGIIMWDEENEPFRDPKFSFRTHRRGALLYYYYINMLDTPYRMLYVNRNKENGERIILPSRGRGYNCSHCWSLEEDQQYIKLKEEMERCDGIQSNYGRDRNHAKTMQLVRLLGIEDLQQADIEECLTQALETKDILKHFDRARKFCLRLLGEDVKEELRTDYNKFAQKMYEKYRYHSHVGSIIYDLILFVDEITREAEGSNSMKSWRSKAASGRKRRKMKSIHQHQEIEAKIDSHFKTEQAKCLEALSKDPKITSVYINLKLKLAEEIGLIKMNKEKGLYEEVYVDIIEGPIDQVKIKYGVE